MAYIKFALRAHVRPLGALGIFEPKVFHIIAESEWDAKQHFFDHILRADALESNGRITVTPTQDAV